ncbi:heat shock 70 kDa protein 12A-like [Mizuhopecten yessoensis]|uniref:Heat shock 70 kDa protein n=1 Tax=Mizuhopecten yessoensis TaxID=6573 RepID=A0A1C9U2Z8_MIZYE|nr:heat shock 70 kDa protein 12A-like [Mizuhopecten yessoensis]XP_021364051.1 heat shock 70 kDa protein 12A-like [Mizuhopecten yessoensis]AOR17362.1 heat shock 70 kDa protein [Mizuhopecten yessoensis]OWF45296.1 Heat shock 70 kDa protein 12A [Mizuhopecten yessoensis]
MEPEAPRKDRLMVAGIDFGTTYSGYAFSFRGEYEENPEKIQVNQNWIAGGALVSVKTATCILLDQDKKLIAFGYEAEDSYNQLLEDSEDDDIDDRTYERYYYFKQFKMSLYNCSEGLSRETMIEDETGKKLPAMLVISMSIGYMKDHLLALINKRCIGAEENDIHWVITIPAIWDDSAKQFMREAAVNCGMRSDQLSFALEPEAASLYCQLVKVVLSEESTPIDAGAMKKAFRSSGAGTKYMILDLGGGTADITVHERQVDESLKEIHEPSGGPWGGTAVDREFLNFLMEIFGKKSVENFKRKYMTDYVEFRRNFETKKRTITPQTDGKVMLVLPPSFKETFEENSNISFNDALSKSKYSGKVQWVKDKLKIDADVVKGFFEVPIQQIVSHVRKLLEKIGRIDMILMVGGFSDCGLVEQAIRDNFSDVSILNPEDSVLAVLKGAVIFGHKPMAIVSRVARYTYGYEAWPTFDPKVHPQERKVRLGDVDCCQGVFQPYIRLGTEIDCGDYITSTHRPVSDEQSDMAINIFISENVAPKYVEDPDVRKLGTLKLPLPAYKPGLNRRVQGRLHFGATEVIIEAKEAETGIIHKATFDCLKRETN